MAVDYSAFDGTVTKSKIIESLLDVISTELTDGENGGWGYIRGLSSAIKIVMNMPSIEETHRNMMEEDEDQEVIDRLVDGRRVISSRAGHIMAEPRHAFVLSEADGGCARCGQGRLHTIHYDRAEDSLPDHTKG